MAITIDDIQASLHSIKVSDGTNDLLIDGSGHISINDGGNSITVDNADITTIAGAVSGTEMQVDVVAPLPAGTNNIGDVDVASLPGTVAADITAIKTAVEILDNAISGTEMQVDVLTMPTVTVTATDLDIRDLTHVSDSVKVGDGTDFLAINADGSLNVQTVPAGLDSWQTSVLSATSTAGEIAATPLSNRLRMVIQNLGTQDVYLGEDNTVTTSTGIKLPKGSSFEFPYGATANIWAITASGTADLRIAEYAD